jgi:hypothetical protein
MMKRLSGFLSSIGLLLTIFVNVSLADSSTNAQNTGVVITNENGKFVLLKNGKPFFMKGVCGYAEPKKLVKIGANSVLVYNSTNLGEILDEAQKYGLTVSAFVFFEVERHGANYHDANFVNAQMETNRTLVQKYKNHPALIAWGVGNEVYLFSTNTSSPLIIKADNENVWKSINDTVKMIHSEDPHHPVFTTITELNPKIVAEVMKFCPDLDLLGLNSYAGITSLPGSVAASPWKKPIIITEWGPNGHWETGYTGWKASIEAASGEKELNYEARYPVVISCTNLLGAYTFFWGYKQEVTPTWYSLLDKKGRTTEAVDALQYGFTGKWPKNRAPHLIFMTMNDRTPNENVMVPPESTNSVYMEISDPENDKLIYTWAIRKESPSLHIGGDEEPEMPDIPVTILHLKKTDAQFIAPKEEGHYRLFVTVTDGLDHFASANYPFAVEELK